MTKSERKTPTIYYRIRGRDVWHFNQHCHHLKSALDEVRLFGAIRTTKPKSGESCNECLSKAKARADKSVSRKHIVARKPAGKHSAKRKGK